MNWNAKPESVTLPLLYPKNQSSFSESTLMNPQSQGSLNSPGNNQPACMFPSNSNSVSQPLHNIRNSKTQQISVSDMHSRTTVASQNSAERITYANVKGPTQLNHSLQMSSGVAQSTWLDSPVRNSMFSHTGATVSQQTGFRTNVPNVNALQNQFVTSDTYSMQVQMIPSNSVGVPGTYQGNQRLNSSERQGDWAQQYTASGLTHPDYRPPPRQYSYPSQSFLQNPPALQKHNLLPSTSLQVKKSHLPNSALNLHSKQPATVQSYQYAVTQVDKRPPPPPPPPPYDCRYVGQTLQNTQHVIKHSIDTPQSQEAHLPEIRKDFRRGFQQQNINENVSQIGNFCNLKVNSNASQPFNGPIRFSVDGVQVLAQNNQEERIDSCNLTSNQVVDTSATKERLVRDIKTLVEMKKKFSELARKVKIDKNILMAAGCIKAANNSYRESAQNSELSLKQTARIHTGPQATLITPETAEGEQPTIMGTAEETNRTHSALDIHCRNFNQVSSIVTNSVCWEKGPNQLHDLKGTTSLKTSLVESAHATLSNNQFSSGNLVSVEENVQTNSETTSASQFVTLEEYASKYQNKNRLLLGLLSDEDKIGKKLVKDSCETIQDSTPYSLEMNPNTQITGNHPNLKTMQTWNINASISDNSFCFEHKPSANGTTSESDSHCSMELLATCLSLWKKPSEPTEQRQCNESATNKTAVGISKAVETCDKSPFSVVGSSQNKMLSHSQVTALPMVVQNSESPGATITKGTELQVAVVSPLILSDVKTLSVKGMTSEAFPETVYPVIKEGSVCSLQNQSAENTSVTAALKVNELVASISTSTKIAPLIQEEKQSESTNGNLEGAPNINKEKHTKSEPDIHYLVNDQQALSNSRDSDIVSSNLLQIDNICSLVEGDRSYNSQIAKIFNSPVKTVGPQKSLLNLPVISRQQTEPLDDITGNKDFGFQKDNFVQCIHVSHKIPNKLKSPQPPEPSDLKNVEANSETQESNLEHVTKESTAIDTCASAAVQWEADARETDVSCSYTAQDPARSEVLGDKTCTLYPHDQLSELLKEFPYGIETMMTCEAYVAQATGQISKDQSCDKTNCDSKDSPDQIKITILNSEQMKELFPEHNDQPSKVDTLTDSQKENPVTKEGSQRDPQGPIDGDSCNVAAASEKDDVCCCALGWLATEYEGIPQCQCNSIKNSTSAVEKGKDQCSSETKSCKQGESTSDRDVPIVFESPLDNNPKITLAFPDGKNHRPEIEKDKNIKETPKTKNNSLKTQELPSQPSSESGKKLDSLQCHKRKEKLKFHEVTFHSTNKNLSQESLQRKLTGQNSHLLKAKTGILTNKNKDLHKKNSSLVQPKLPEKKKMKASDSEHKVSGKRKLGEGNVLDSEIKRVKYNKQEQKKNGGSIFKIRNFLSNPDERAKAKEKVVSNVKSSSSKDCSSKSNRVLSVEYFQRQKHKETMGIKASKKNLGKNTPCDSQYAKTSKLPMQVGSCGKSNERHSSVQTSKESLNICTSHDKNIKTHHPEGSKTYLSGSVKETVGEKQPDKMWIDKTKPDKNLNSVNNGVELGQMSPQAKEQTKQYLNRVAFKCTERESICLTNLEGLSKKLKSESLLIKKDTTEKQNMLEFKLCPDGLINKRTNYIEQQKDLQPCPGKEQAPVQVTGIKSTKEDWMKGAPEEKRIAEVSQEIDGNVLGNSKNAKRTFSADGFNGLETLQNAVKDSKAMFQTYKKMYLEKRSRSLGSSPSK